MCMAASAYYVIWKEVNNHILSHNWIVKTCCLNNPHWQSSRIIMFLCKYYIVFFRYTGRLFLGCACALFVARCNIIRASWETKTEKDWVTEKSAWKNLCEGHHFLTAFLCHFLLLSSSTPPSLLCLLFAPGNGGGVGESSPPPANPSFSTALNDRANVVKNVKVTSNSTQCKKAEIQ